MPDRIREQLILQGDFFVLLALLAGLFCTPFLQRLRLRGLSKLVLLVFVILEGHRIGFHLHGKNIPSSTYRNASRRLHRACKIKGGYAAGSEAALGAGGRLLQGFGDFGNLVFVQRFLLEQVLRALFEKVTVIRKDGCGALESVPDDVGRSCVQAFGSGLADGS